MEAKLLAFPVRSLAGCFAWLTCPAALKRFQRDAGRKFDIPGVDKDRVVAGAELVVNKQVVLEEYAMDLQSNSNGQAATLAGQLIDLCADPLWTRPIDAKGQPLKTSGVFNRLAIVHDENFQHFVTTCTEVVQRIKISPRTRTVDGSGLFNQENVPCETLFYSVLTLLPSRRPPEVRRSDVAARLGELLPNTALSLQFGGDETTGHGFCSVQRLPLPLPIGGPEPGKQQEVKP